MMRRAWMAPAKNQRFWLSSESLCAMRAEEREPDFFERDARGAGEAPRRGERTESYEFWVHHLVCLHFLTLRKLFGLPGSPPSTQKFVHLISPFLKDHCCISFFA